MLHRDNTPSHTALFVTEFLTSKDISMVPKPPLFTWSQPCDSFLFPKLKNALKGCHFGSLENIQKSIMDMLKTIPVEDFQHCKQKWERLHRCVAAQGNYFGRNNIDV